jgi:hypothetical protein
MNTARWLTLVGGMLLLVGLFMTLAANRSETKAMGRAARLGVSEWAPQKGSPEWEQKKQLRTRADRRFGIGLIVTALGVALQTAGALWPSQ